MQKTLTGYILTDDYERKLWSDCLFVFDSSALLNFYEYSNDARKEINKTIFKQLKGRLWITKQTEYEYLKNRETVLVKPAKLYDELLSVHFDLKSFQTFKNQFNQLKERTKKTNKHPHIKQALLTDFETKIASFEKEISNFKEELNKEIEKKKTEIHKIKTKDTILNLFARSFLVGAEYSFEKKMEIVTEGELRYRNSIPPGYEDLKEKIGLQIYGDLIIWNQILDLAKEKKKPIILIIDDLKIDWCYKNQQDKNIIDSPREELIMEMKDKCGVDFWSYSSNQFLDKSNDLLGTVIAESVIEEVKESNQYMMVSRVEQIVYHWAQQYFQGEVLYLQGPDYGVDFLIMTPEMHIGLEVKYYPKFRKQSVQNLLEHLIPRFRSRGVLDIFEKIIIVIACETKELAEEINLTRSQTLTESKIQIVIGHIDHGIFVII